MENAQKIGAAGNSNPGPRGFVVFRAALVTARTNGKTLTWVGKEGIHSETMKFVKTNSETVNVCTRVSGFPLFCTEILEGWKVENVCLHCHMILVRVALGLGLEWHLV